MLWKLKPVQRNFLAVFNLHFGGVHPLVTLVLSACANVLYACQCNVSLV
jgi:hypothetical protein